MTLLARRVQSCRATTLFCTIFACIWAAAPLGAADSPVDLKLQVRQHEAVGDLAGAENLLKSEASAPGNTAAIAALAEFLDRHQNSGARVAYLHWAMAESDPEKKRLALRQVLFEDLAAGRQDELSNDLKQYREFGGTDFMAPAARAKSSPYSMVTIPGPLPSFARMAALAPDLAPEDLLPALARNVVTNGFEASGNEMLQPTEYLRLLTRYIGQARELQQLANKDHKILIPACDSEQTGDLLKVLGYRMRGTCGADIVSTLR